MQEVVLDPAGRLLSWQRIRAREDSPDRDIQATLAFLFAESGLDGTKLIRETPSDRPADPIVWRGPFPDAAGRVRVDASIHDGRVSLFLVSRDEVTQSAATFGDVLSDVKLQMTLRALLVPVVLAVMGIGTLVVRNLRLKRGDRHGAFRIAVFGATTSFLALKLGVHFPPSLDDAIDLWMVSDAQPVYWAFVGWLYYIALEPELRRTWPHLLISWSRLLSGRVRDPLVGRDVLLGVTAGLLWAALWMGSAFVPDPAGSMPLDLPTLALASTREAVLVMFRALYPSVLLALGWLLMPLVFFRVTRSRPLAVFLLWLLLWIVSVNLLDGPYNAAIVAPLMSGLIVAVVFRLGLLATAVMVYISQIVLSLPLTTQIGVWYGWASVLAVGVALGLAVYGFVVSLGDKPLFGRAVLE